jgi:hypothetical protein
MADLRQPSDTSDLGLASAFGYIEPTDVAEIRGHIV